jgi:uncharacterized phiE125 gp8 family phage protein
MMLVDETPVPAAALPVQAFKDHLRMGSGFAEDSLQDALLEGFLRAALSTIEGRTAKAIYLRNFSLTLGAWRSGDRQALPLAPVEDVSAVTLISATGDETPVPSTAWRLVPDLSRPLLVSLGGALPVIPQNGSVRISFAAGFGASWDLIPGDLRQAIMMLAAHYYDYRQDTTLGAGCMPFGVTALIDRYRPVRIGFGGL